MYDRDKIKFITHHLSSDIAIFQDMQGVILLAEWKRKMPRISIWVFSSNSYHFALIVSEKKKRREIKGEVIQQILHLIDSSLFLMR